MISLMG